MLPIACTSALLLFDLKNVLDRSSGIISLFSDTIDEDGDGNITKDEFVKNATKSDFIKSLVGDEAT